jgi:hypothetical protein
MDLVTYFRIRTSLDFLVKLSALVSYSLPIGPHVPQRLGSRLVQLCVQNPSSGVSLVVIWIHTLPHTACTTHIRGSSLYTQFTAL